MSNKLFAETFYFYLSIIRPWSIYFFQTGFKSEKFFVFDSGSGRVDKLN